MPQDERGGADAESLYHPGPDVRDPECRHRRPAFTHRNIGRARQADSANSRVRVAQQYLRAAQFYTDFIEAENSMGFHADQEAVRILADAIKFARSGEAALRGENVPAAPLVALAQSAHRRRLRSAEQ